MGGTTAGPVCGKKKNVLSLLRGHSRYPDAFLEALPEPRLNSGPRFPSSPACEIRLVGSSTLGNHRLFGAATLFILVEEAGRRAAAQGTVIRGTHPAPIMMRAFFAVFVFARQGPFEKVERAVELGGTILNAAHRALHAVVDDRPETSFEVGLLAPSRNAHMHALGQRWHAMHPRLVKLAAEQGAEPGPIDLVESFILS